MPNYIPNSESQEPRNRESFQKILGRTIAQRKRELLALQELQKISDGLEIGSALEELLWRGTFEKLLK